MSEISSLQNTSITSSTIKAAKFLIRGHLRPSSPWFLYQPLLEGRGEARRCPMCSTQVHVSIASSTGHSTIPPSPPNRPSQLFGHLISSEGKVLLPPSSSRAGQSVFCGFKPQSLPHNICCRGINHALGSISDRPQIRNEPNPLSRSSPISLRAKK